jgi:carboxyl-terminal processing protease
MSIASAARTRSGLAPRSGALVALSLALASCGGDDGTDAATTPPPSSTYAARCASPRSGTDPLTGEPYPDKQGTSVDEKSWLRSWTDELYLWYREVPALDPASYATPGAYFAVLKTAAITSSGRPKDRFHFTYPTDEWNAFSQSGVEAGYGVQWVVVASSPPRRVVAAYREARSPAETAGLDRGAAVLSVDGVDMVNGADTTTLNAGLFPSSAGETHTFTVLDLGASSPRTFAMTSTTAESTPVQDVETLDTPTGTVGYFAFHDHIATAEAHLVDAISQIQAAGVTDLIVDLRYNGGGYLDIASELAYMIAGPAATSGKAFERQVWNDKHTVTNPVTGKPLTYTPFHTATLGFSLAEGQALPYLGLGRVFVLTGGSTCSASEAILNGLRGVDVSVIQVGSTTCGKPYGFYAQDNCGTTYFSIEFQGVNAKGFGDYPDGFVPGGSGDAGLAGCSVSDDFAHLLGDPAEGRLAAALYYREHGSCPASSQLAQALTGGTVAARTAADGYAVKPPWRENRIMRR